MSQDIRSMFARLSKKSHVSLKQKQTSKIIDSEDDEMIEKTTNKVQPKKHSSNKHTRKVLSSDSEEDTKMKSSSTQNKQNMPMIMKPLNIDDVFNKAVRQTKPIKIENNEKSTPKSEKKKKINTELGIHKNKDFEKTLMELDEESDDTILMENMDLLDKTFEDAWLSESEKTKQDKSQGGDKSKDEKNKKRQRKKSESESTPSKKAKLEYTDSGCDLDQEKWEKRRHSAALYQQYLHRGGPKHHGQKEYPKGTPNCLSNLTFLRTGVLDTLESDEFDSLVKEHGGRNVHSVSKKVNYVVVGDQPGPAKLEKARKYNISEISEDEFLDLILKKSGQKSKYAVKYCSEDLGIGTSESESSGIVVEKNEVSQNLKNEHEKKQSSSGCTDVSGGNTHKPNLKKLKGNDKQTKGKFPKEKLDVSAAKTEKLIIDTGESQNSCEKSKSEKTVTVKEKPELEETKQQNSKNISERESPMLEKVKSENESHVMKVSTENMSWTEKYKPSNTKDIIGQKEQNSNMNKLKKWLENWHRNQDPDRRKKMARPSPFNQCDGEWYKAALLSGPPGVGKTTTATLVAQELGFDVVEFNASDTRNKKLLHEEISQMMQTTTVAGYVSGEKNINKKRILLMDEVDGMAGNEDRGGIAELINFIKVASFPIICMCNNREHQKMRTLVSHCYGLKFGRPNVQQVKAAMLSICFKENIQIKPEALAQLIVGTGGDIRQTLNHLSMWSATEKNLSSEMIEHESKKSRKDVVYGPWDVIRKVFNTSENKDMALSEKSRLFFYDYSIGPLFVQENYLQVTPDCTGPKSERDSEILVRKSLAADALSMGDLVESKIRSTNNWALLESQAFYSTVLPSHYMSGTLGRTNFPGWLGKNSQRNKSLRMISELYSHARMNVSGDKFSMRLDYAVPLRNLLISPMTNKGIDGVRDTLEVMKSYSLIKDDLINICELLAGFSNPNIFSSIDSKVKSALTRLYNKEMILNFAPVATSKKKTPTVDEDNFGQEDEDVSDQETEDNITDDTLIKVKEAGKRGNSKSSGIKGKSTENSKKSKGKGNK